MAIVTYWRIGVVDTVVLLVAAIATGALLHRSGEFYPFYDGSHSCRQIKTGRQRRHPVSHNLFDALLF